VKKQNPFKTDFILKMRYLIKITKKNYSWCLKIIAALIMLTDAEKVQL